MAGIAARAVILKPGDLLEVPWVPLLAEAGLNTLMLHAARVPEEIDALIIWAASDAGRALREECARHGIRLETEMHTASWLVPRAEFHARPHLFRQDLRGERTPDANWCFSSEEAWALAERRLGALAAALPSDTGRYLWFPDDTAEGLCHCERCAPLSAADQSLLYARRLAEMLGSLRPAAQVSYLAYLGTMGEVPAAPVPEGVLLEYAPIRRCYRHALDDLSCAVNRAHLQALGALLPAFAGRPLHATEYWLDASRHSGWRRPAQRLPVSEDVMRRDTAAYARLGFTSIASYAVMCDRDYWQAFGPPPVLAYGRALAEAPAAAG